MNGSSQGFTMITLNSDSNNARLINSIDVMPREAHSEHVSMLTTERDINQLWTTLQNSSVELNRRRIDLVNFIGLLKTTIQTWSGRSTAMEASQEVLRMAARMTDGSQESVGYVEDCMTSEKTQKMTKDARSAFVGQLQGLKTEAKRLLGQIA